MIQFIISKHLSIMLADWHAGKWCRVQKPGLYIHAYVRTEYCSTWIKSKAVNNRRCRMIANASPHKIIILRVCDNPLKIWNGTLFSVPQCHNNGLVTYCVLLCEQYLDPSCTLHQWRSFINEDKFHLRPISRWSTSVLFTRNDSTWRNKNPMLLNSQAPLMKLIQLCLLLFEQCLTLFRQYN